MGTTMRAISIAAILSALIAAPVPAVADETISESFSLSFGPSNVPHTGSEPLFFTYVASTPLPLFNSANGKLDKVTVTISGTAEASSIAETPTLDFALGDPEGRPFFEDEGVSVLSFITIDYSVFFSVFFATNPWVYSGPGTAGPDGSIFFGFSTPAPDHTTVIESDGPLTGLVTYEYTPKPTLTLSVPETSTWAMMLVGFAGLAFAVRGRFRNLTRLAGAC
jgi:hypothetical protein